MSITVDAAAQLYGEALRTSVRKSWLRYLAQGGLMILAGLLAIIFPVISSEAIVLTLGWLLMLTGAAQAMGLITAHRGPFAGLQLISVVLALLVGFLILRSPAQSLTAFSLLIVVFLMIEGMSKIVWSHALRPIPAWYWVLLSGVLSIVLAIVLAVSVDTASTWLLAVLLGVQLLSAGASLAYLALLTRRT